MKRVLVTGGTGFLGEHVIQCLIAARDADANKQYDVRTIARSRSPVLARLADTGDVSMIRGDIMTGDELPSALDGCEIVVHLAGMVSREPDDSQRMMRLHIDGTRRVFECAKQAGVRRIVVASTSGTIAVSDIEEVLDERAAYPTELVAGWPYYVSKIYQEKLAFELGKTLDIECVCVNPSLLLGPGDRRLSSTKDVLRFMRKQIPSVTEGGVNFVDARDAAQATVAAIERGRPGERYLLGGPNWTVDEFFGRLERACKVRRPRLKLPERLSFMGASMLEHVYRWRDKEPPIDRMSVEMGYHYWWCDSTKAERELGFHSRDPSLTLVDTVRYLRKNIDPDV